MFVLKLSGIQIVLKKNTHKKYTITIQTYDKTSIYFLLSLAYHNYISKFIGEQNLLSDRFNTVWKRIKIYKCKIHTPRPPPPPKK